MLKDGWKFVSTMCGGQYVMTFGATPMQVLCVRNWDTPMKMVQKDYYLFITVIMH